MKKKKYPPWYKTTGLKHVTGFVTSAEKQKLRRLAEAADKSLSRYVTRLLQQHIKDAEAAEAQRAQDEQRRQQPQLRMGDGDGKKKEGFGRN